MHSREPARSIPLDGPALLGYFALSFALAWGVWIAVGVLAPDAKGLVVLGAWAPTIAAILITWRTRGARGVRALLAGLLRWRVGVRYYAFAVLGVLGVGLLALALTALLGGAVPRLGMVAARFGLPAERPSLFLAAAPLVYLATVFAGGPIAEELGWRGFAQPRLQAQLGAGRAGLVIGLVWSLWHLPLFFAFPSAVGSLPLGYYVPLVTALGVLFAWLYDRTGGSVLLCVLLHAGANVAIGVIGAGSAGPHALLLGIFVALMAALALVLYRRLRAQQQVR